MIEMSLAEVAEAVGGRLTPDAAGTVTPFDDRAVLREVITGDIAGTGDGTPAGAARR